jgi:hypothetical protein
VDKDAEDLPTLDSTRPREMKLSIKAWITKSVRQCKIHHLREATWIVAKGPAHVVSEIISTMGSLYYMVNHCITANHLLCYFSEPSMMREPFQAQLDVEGNNGALSKTINIPQMEA